MTQRKPYDPPRVQAPTERILALVRICRTMEAAMHSVHQQVLAFAKHEPKNATVGLIAQICDPVIAIDAVARTQFDANLEAYATYIECDRTVRYEETHYSRTTIGINRRAREYQRRKRNAELGARFAKDDMEPPPSTPRPPRQPTEVERKIDALRAKQQPAPESTTESDPPDFRNYKPEDWGSES